MDRIDIHIETPAVKIEELQESQTGEGSSAIRERVEARDVQKLYFEYGSRFYQCKHSSKFDGSGLNNRSRRKELL